MPGGRVLDGIARGGCLINHGAPVPLVAGLVLDGAVGPVEPGYHVEWHIPRGVEGLVIGDGCTEFPDLGHDGVSPALVLVRIEVAVDGHIGFVDARVGGRIEGELEGLGQIPRDGRLAEPRECLGVGDGNFVAVVVGIDVAELLLLIGSVDGRREGDGAGEPVDLELLAVFAENLGERAAVLLAAVFLARILAVLPLGVGVALGVFLFGLERCPGREVGRIAVVEIELPVAAVGILSRGVVFGRRAVGVGGHKVGGIPGLGLFGLDVEPDVGECEVGVFRDGLDECADRVLLAVGRIGVERFVEGEILVVGVILGRGDRLGPGVVHLG